MPTLHNPTDSRLACYRIGLILAAGETVEITDEDADALEHGTVFVVERDAKPAKVEKPAAEEAEAEEKATPVRKTVKRGAKQTEVTKAPERETRG